MRTKQELMRDGECVNGDGRPITPTPPEGA